MTARTDALHHPNIARVVAADRLAAELGAAHVRRADGDEARAATGFSIGGVPPLGHARVLPVLMDRHLLEHRQVWAAAGLPDAVFAVEPAALLKASRARTADLAADLVAG